MEVSKERKQNFKSDVVLFVLEYFEYIMQKNNIQLPN